MEKVHWTTPSLMVGSLLAGAALASYNLIYQKALSSISNQVINIAIGTAFAFLVKTCLVCAVRMAYTQILWKTVRGQSTKVAALDSMFSTTNNILKLFHGRLWLSYPLMMFLALLTWLLPLASLIAPGTLAVSLQRYNSSFGTIVPMADFTKLSFANALGGLDGVRDHWDKNTGEYDYAGPQDAVNEVVMETMFGGRISSITPPTINSSWELTFPGPALRCNTITGADKEAIVDNIWQASIEEGCRKTYAYVAWAPLGRNGLLPFPMNSTWSNPWIQSSTSFYVAVLDKLLHSWDHIPGPTCSGQPEFKKHTPSASISEDAKILRCELQNVSYHTKFLYENGIQTVGITLGQFYNNASLVDRVLSIPLDESSNSRSDKLPYNDRLLIFGSPSDSVNRINPIAMLAYQSLMDSFQKPLLGTISNNGFFENGITALNTSIMSMALSNQPELAFIRNFIWEVPHQSLEDNDRSRAYFNKTVLSELPLAGTIEQLFQNLTISLFSDQHFQYNMSLPGAPSPVEVQTWTDRNVYVYGAPVLWLSYGLALVFSTAGVIVGLVVMGVTGAAFSASFSTYLRTIRQAGLSLEIHSSDLDGADPLPKYLAEAQLVFFKTVKREDEGNGQTESMLGKSSARESSEG